MKSSRLTISPACEGRVKPGATDPTFTLSFTRRKPIDSSPEYHAIILSESILWGICIKRCESVEGIDGLWTGPCFSLHPDTMFGGALVTVIRRSCNALCFKCLQRVAVTLTRAGHHAYASG